MEGKEMKCVIPLSGQWRKRSTIKTYNFILDFIFKVTNLKYIFL